MPILLAEHRNLVCLAIRCAHVWGVNEDRAMSSVNLFGYI